MTTRRQQFRVLRAVVVTVALAAVACGGSDEASAPSTSKASKPKRTTSTSTSTTSTSSSTASTSTSTTTDGPSIDPAGSGQPGASPSDQGSAQTPPDLCDRVSYETVVAVLGGPATASGEGPDHDGKGRVCAFMAVAGDSSVCISLYPLAEKQLDDHAGVFTDVLDVPAKVAVEWVGMFVETPEGLLEIEFFGMAEMGKQREYQVAIANQFLASA